MALIDATRGVLPKMREGHPYNRAGVMLTGLTPAGARPLLWASGDDRRPGLAAVVDEISNRFGRQAIGYGPTGFRARQSWDMRREQLSAAATTNWDQLLTVR